MAEGRPPGLNQSAGGCVPFTVPLTRSSQTPVECMTATGLEVEGRLHDMPVLRLWRGSSLPFRGWLQPQTTPATPRRSPQEAVCVVGTHVTVGDGLGSGGWVARDAV